MQKIETNVQDQSENRLNGFSAPPVDRATLAACTARAPSIWPSPTDGAGIEGMDWGGLPARLDRATRPRVLES